MDIVKKNVNDLIPNPNNVRKHTQSQIEEFKKSIKKFGVIRPIVIDENNVILAGHGLLEALKENGVKTADVVIMKGLSENDKKKLLLADNKIYSLGTDNYEAIEAILTELGQDSDFEIPGYNSETLEELYGIKSVEAEVEQNGTPVKNALSDVSDNKKVEVKSSDSSDNAAEPTPSNAFEKAREEAENRKFVICPNCGEKIWL